MSLEIKICGLKSAEAMAAALDCGAHQVGFIFFPKSPRHLTPGEAAALRGAAVGRAKAVAVTVDADDRTLADIVSQVEPDILQLHGRETPARVAALKDRFGLTVVKALAVREAADVAAAEQYRGVADRLLFDAKPPAGAELPGGNGLAFDWRLLAGLDRNLDYMLSGGLNAANLADALRLARPAAVDVSSGVERAPGVKDVRLIAEFFQAVAAMRGAFAA